MKPLLTLTVAVVTSFSGMAQAQADSAARADAVVRADLAARADAVLRTLVRVVPFVDAIDAILGDLPNNLRYVTGALLLAEGETDSYTSLVVVPNAEKCIVTRYHSVEDTAAREGIRFTTSTLKLRTDDERFRDVMVQLELVYQLADWAVNINVVTKKPDDAIGGVNGRN